MEDKLIEILEQFNYPVIRFGSMGENEPYPDHFFTFSNLQSDGSSFYDNDEHSIVYTYFIRFFSNDPANCYNTLLEAKKKLKENGFIAFGAGYDVDSDEATHTGRGMQIKYIQII